MCLHRAQGRQAFNFIFFLFRIWFFGDTIVKLRLGAAASILMATRANTRDVEITVYTFASKYGKNLDAI